MLNKIILTVVIIILVLNIWGVVAIGQECVTPMKLTASDFPYEEEEWRRLNLAWNEETGFPLPLYYKPNGVLILYMEKNPSKVLFVSIDRLVYRILSFVFTIDGNGIWSYDDTFSYGEFGNGVGEFATITGITSSAYLGYNSYFFDPNEDFIFVSDCGNNRIVKLSFNSINNKFNWEGFTGQAYLLHPRGIVYSTYGTHEKDDDDLFVADYGHNRLVRFSKDGIYETSIGMQGYGEGETIGIYGLTVGYPNSYYNNYVYCSDFHLGKILSYESIPGGALTFVNELIVDDMPRVALAGIAVDEHGIIYVCDYNNDRIIKTDGGLDGIIESIGETGCEDYQFDHPLGLFCDGDDLLITERFTECSGLQYYKIEPADTIDGDQTWTGDICINRDLVIKCGASLTLMPGTRLRFAAGDGGASGINPSKSELIVYGELVSMGNANDSVFIISDEETPSLGDWYGIRFLYPCGEGYFDYTRIAHADFGIDGDYDIGYEGRANIEFYNGSIDSCAYSGIDITRNIFTIESSRILNCGEYGISLCEPNTTRITGNTISGNTAYGISTWFIDNYADSIIIAGNTIMGNNGPYTQYGIHTASEKVRISENVIACFIQGGIQVFRFGGQGDIEPYIFDNNIIGTGTYVGLNCICGTNPVIRYNNIQSTETGVYVSGGSFPDLGQDIVGEYGNNTIYQNIDIYVSVHNLSPIDIKAENNWWGSDQPPAEKFFGPVDYIPFLLTPPEQPGRESADDLVRPLIYGLKQNYPNPFNTSTVIRFSIRDESDVELEIYNILGQLVKRLVHDRMAPGTYSYRWNSTDSYNRPVSSGIYFYKLTAGDVTFKRKMMLLR